MYDKWVLITDVLEDDLGWPLAKEFLANEFNLIATASTLAQLEFLPPSPYIEKLELDVTSTESIKAVAEKVRLLTGGCLDILVNNTGYAFVAPILDADIESVRKGFNVNTSSIIAMTQTVFPMLQAANGIVANQASFCGLPRVSMPFMGVFCASKGAMIALSNCMWVEFALFGVKVVTLVTGGVLTTGIKKAAASMAEPSKLPSVPQNTDQISQMGVDSSSRYWPAVKDKMNNVPGTATGSPDERFPLPISTTDQSADVWARRVVRDLLRPSPLRRIYRGSYSTTMLWITWLAPDWFLDCLFTSEVDLQKLKAE